MEMGNMMFGNSRGEYPLPRGEGWEAELIRLFDAIDPNRDNSWREYGLDFENDTFFLMPYYRGDCECGRDDFFIPKLEEFQKNNNHKDDCIRIKLDAVEKKYESTFDVPQQQIKDVCKEYNLPYCGWGNHCTCDYNKRYDELYNQLVTEFGGEHKDSCRLIKPNFLYKSTGFEIQWYKYPLRDSYKNQDITLEEFKLIIDKCIESLK